MIKSVCCHATVSIVMVLGLGACGNGSSGGGEHWYSEQKSRDQDRRGYVESQQQLGVSELEAKEAWQADQMIGNTQNRYRSVESSGEELQEKLGR